MTTDINQALTAFAAWLTSTPLNKLTAETAWIVPTVQVVHILSVAATLAATAIISLNTLGLADRNNGRDAVLARYLPTLWITLPILAATGLLLIAAEPTRAIFRTIFWIKLALIVAATALTVSLRHGDLAAAPLNILVGRRTRAVVAIALWLAVVVAGRWIGYAIGWPGSP